MYFIGCFDSDNELVSATNEEDKKEAIKQALFLKDLYYDVRVYACEDTDEEFDIIETEPIYQTHDEEDDDMYERDTDQ